MAAITGLDGPVIADIEAEKSVLGLCMTSRSAVEQAAEILWAEEFYDTRHQDIFRALIDLHLTDRPTDPITLKNELQARGRFGPSLRPDYLLELHAAPMVGAQLGYHAAFVAEAAQRRRMVMALTRGLQRAERLDTAIDEVLADTLADLDLARAERAGARAEPATATELDDLLAATEENTYDWIIRDFMERRDRLLLTGPEGGGKSTFLRQVGIQAASGIHPLDGSTISPLRVLHVDLENSEDQCRRELRPLRIVAGDRYQRGQYHLRARPEGIDLTAQQDRDWLFRLAESINPDLLTIGPIYKMANGDPTEETSAKPVAVTLDKLRVQMGCGLLIEAHPPKTTHGTKRAIEPYGWSGWLRWPEFGMHLAMDGQITHWRGQRDARRTIPAAMQRGGEWPWTPLTRPRDVLWARISSLCIEAGDQLSYRDLAKMTGTSVGAVQKAIDEHRIEWGTLEAAA